MATGMKCFRVCKETNFDDNFTVKNGYWVQEISTGFVRLFWFLLIRPTMACGTRRFDLAAF